LPDFCCIIIIKTFKSVSPIWSSYMVINKFSWQKEIFESWIYKETIVEYSEYIHLKILHLLNCITSLNKLVKWHGILVDLHVLGK
jgi:hypothetical protein